MHITDGRETFYQWDLNVSITSENFIPGDEVHFSNRKSATAQVVIVKESAKGLIAEVPNELLQVAMDITAYRYTKSGESEFTTRKAVFKVDKRPRPDDYIYTPTEVFRYEDLKKEIEDIMGDVSSALDELHDYAQSLVSGGESE